jgi:predicted  nucleic acid-binding Zn-ribbon protein
VIDPSSLVGRVSSPDRRDSPDSEIIDLKPNLISIDKRRLSRRDCVNDSSDLESGNLADSISIETPIEPLAVCDSNRELSQEKVATTQPIEGERFDVDVELDSLLTTLKSTETPDLDSETERHSISESLAEIAAAQPIAQSQQLLAELRATREQISISHAQLQSLDRENRDRVDTVDTSLLEVKQLKFRTQQLARHSKNQIEKVREMLVSLEQVRAEVIAGLDKFGGYEEIRSMLAQLAETRHALILAHDRLKTGQEAFYESLRAMSEQVAANSNESEAKLLDYQQSISHLTQEISADRLKIAMTSADLTLKVSEINGMNGNISTIHQQIVDKSQTLQTSIVQLDRKFGELSQSVQTEKEQFYELTAETIDKVEGMRLQFVDIAKQNRLNCETIEQLKTEIDTIRQNVSYESEQQLDRFDRHYDETIATWGDLQVRQKASTRDARRFYNWLWLLSFAVGVLFVLLVTVLLTIR